MIKNYLNINFIRLILITGLIIGVFTILFNTNNIIEYTKNQERKKIQEETFLEAESLLRNGGDLKNKKVIVLASEIFHPGVIGISASKIVDKYHRPTVLIAIEEGLGKGSGRSIPKFNLFRAFTDCSSHLIQFGGHAYAAGLSIKEENIDNFCVAMNKVGSRYLKEKDLIPQLRIDSILKLSQIDLALYKSLSLLEPFGAENPVPIFQSNEVKIKEVKYIGKEKNHIRFYATQGARNIAVVAFNFAHIFDSIDIANEVFDITYELHLLNIL